MAKFTNTARWKTWQDYKQAQHADRTPIKKRPKRLRALQAQRFDSVNRYFVCPVCSGDHSKADHAEATDTLSTRAARAQTKKTPPAPTRSTNRRPRQDASHLGVLPPGLQARRPELEI